MDAVEFLKKYHNLCKSNIKCKECPICKHIDNKYDYSICINFMFKNPEKIVEIISNL